MKSRMISFRLSFDDWLKMKQVMQARNLSQTDFMREATKEALVKSSASDKALIN